MMVQPNAEGKIGKASLGYTHMKVAQRWHDCISNLAWFHLSVEPAEYQRLLLAVRYFEP